MVMRKEERRMAKHKLCSHFFLQEHPLEETRDNVLVSLVHCKDLPFATETFSL